MASGDETKSYFFENINDIDNSSKTKNRPQSLVHDTVTVPPATKLYT
jgi:hypothetical protein